MTDPGVARFVGAINIVQPLVVLLEEILHIPTPSHATTCPGSKQTAQPERLLSQPAKCHHKRGAALKPAEALADVTATPSLPRPDLSAGEQLHGAEEEEERAPPASHPACLKTVFSWWLKNKRVTLEMSA